jgi:hypothetical protein
MYAPFNEKRQPKDGIAVVPPLFVLNSGNGESGIGLIDPAQD